MAYDNVCKFLIDSYPTPYLQWILGHPIVAEPEVLKTELPIEPIRADFVSFWKIGNQIVHVEFQTEPQENVPLRMLNYYVRLHTLYRLEVNQTVIYLRETGSERASQTRFRSRNTLHRYNVIRLWEQDPDRLLQDPELLPFAVLANSPSPEGLLRQVAQQIEQVEERSIQSDLAACVEVLGGLRFRREILRGLFREEIVKESVIYQDILQEGIREGIREGIQAGAQRKAQEMVLGMLAEGIEIDVIARVSGLAPEAIRQIVADGNNTRTTPVPPPPDSLPGNSGPGSADRSSPA